MAGDRDCRFVIAIMCVVAFMAAAGTGVIGDDSQQPDFTPECMSPIVSLSPCLEFITDMSDAAERPVEDCCPALATVLADKPVCLCQLFGSNDFLGFPINRTLASALPAACYINAPPETCKDISLKPAPANAPPIPGILTPGSPPPPRVSYSPPPPPVVSTGSNLAPVNIPSVPSSDTGSVQSTPLPVPVPLPAPAPVPTRSPARRPDAQDKEGNEAGAVFTLSIMVLVWELLLISMLSYL